MKKIVLFPHTQSRYGVIPVMIEQLKEALERKNVQVLIPNCSSMDELVDFVKREMPDCTWGINLYIESKYFYDSFGIPHVEISLDSMTYDSYFLYAPHRVMMFVDRASVNLLTPQRGLFIVVSSCNF